jgi:pimeloyl-ACP methyl ester carboxylesterase
MPLAPRLTLVAVALLVTAAPTRADLIFLKDGHVLQGTVRREVRPEFDPVSRDMIAIPKGFFTIDDGPRRITFAPAQVRIIETLPAPTEERVISHPGKLLLNPRILPPHLEVAEVGKWDVKKWERDYWFKTPDMPRVGVRQAIAALSPYYARVDAITKFRWSAAYLTREWEPETVIELLRNSRALAESPKEAAPQAVTKRFRLCDFLAQAGWLDHAEKELDRLLKDFPDQKERVATARGQIERTRARDVWEEVKNWYHAGRHDAVRKRLASFPTKNVSDRVLTDVGEMRAKLAASAELTAQTARALDETILDATTTSEGKALVAAAKVIRAELHPATADRLDAFLGQHRDAMRQKARNKKPALSPDQLLSLAVTGWLLGSPSAEARPEAAVNLWKTRQMVLDYLREPEPGPRRKLLEGYLGQVTPRVDLDEIAQMIDHLPPAEPAPDTSTKVIEWTTGSSRRPTSYFVKLPPEYTHNRQYPVLVLLHDGGERPEAVIERFEKHAADHGYILAAPAWSHKTSNEYHYTDREHEAVMNAVRDLRRRYQVDSDRVFLFGLGEGGKGAFDIGLTHPDVFAGVLPMAAAPNYFSKRCWRNAQMLPFYVVTGTRGADHHKLLTEQFTAWVQRAYPALWVDYKGRGTEFFPAELPHMFDWMRHQRRAFPLRQLGTDGNGTPFGNEFCTMRGEDNRFYWLEATHVSPRCVVTPDRWDNFATPAMLTARFEPVANEITIKGSGVSELTVWFGRNAAGQYLVDFDKPVSIRVGLRGMWNRRVTPSLAVMLEDLQKRGDRKRLVVAKVDLNLR